MGNRLTTFQNLLEQQLRVSQSIVVYLIRIEQTLGDIRDGRMMAISENTPRLARQLSTIEETGSDEDTINGSNTSDGSFLEQAIV